MGLTLKGTGSKGWHRIKSLGGFKVAPLSLESKGQINIKMSTEAFVSCGWFPPSMLVNVHPLSLITAPHISNWPPGADYLYREINVFRHVSIIVEANPIMRDAIHRMPCSLAGFWWYISLWQLSRSTFMGSVIWWAGSAVRTAQDMWAKRLEVQHNAQFFSSKGGESHGQLESLPKKVQNFFKKERELLEICEPPYVSYVDRAHAKTQLVSMVVACWYNSYWRWMEAVLSRK